MAHAVAIEFPEPYDIGVVSPRAEGISVVGICTERELIACGLRALLSPPWQADTAGYETLGEFNRAIDDGRFDGVIVDAVMPGAGSALARAQEEGVSAVLLLDAPRQRVDERLLAAANGVLCLGEADGEMLSIALTAATRGMRLLPASLPPVAPVEESGGRPGTGRALEALALVADGCRDAEIGLRLGITEDAARKLVQRDMARLGAHTRCEAVARAIAGGHLA